MPLSLALGRVHLDGDAAAVVGDAYAAVRQQPDVDGVAVTGEGLVDGVVDDLVHEVVQASLTGGADVHAGPLAYGFKAFENGDRAGVVRAGVHLRGHPRILGQDVGLVVVLQLPQRDALEILGRKLLIAGRTLLGHWQPCPFRHESRCPSHRPRPAHTSCGHRRL